MTLAIANAQSNENVEHEFTVYKYYYQTQVVPEIIVNQTEQKRMLEITISTNKTNYTIDSCDTAAPSFLLTNPSTEQHIYSFSIENYVGEAQVPTDIFLPGRSAVMINFGLTPKCGKSGDFNPRLVVETANEKAKLPILLHVLPVDLLDEEDCSFYYNASVCGSNSYVKILQGSSYVIDLSEMFYDPDGDYLKYSVEYSGAAKIWIWRNKATIKPRFDWYGKEEIVFIAEDGKGGKAESRKIFLHVVPNRKSYAQNFLAAYFIPILSLFALLIIAIVTIIFLKNRGPKQVSKKRSK